MRVAALTMMYNEPVWAQVWARHYAREVGAENCLILDHGTTDGSLDGLPVTIERLRRSALDEDARAALVSDCVAVLLRSYDAVVHTDADELLIVDPEHFADLRAYAAVAPAVVTAIGLDLQHLPDEEAVLDPALSLGVQRRWVRFSGAMCKPAMVRTPVRWEPGFHRSDAAPVPGPVYLVHLRYADLAAGLARLARTRAQDFARPDTNLHQRVPDQAFEAMVRSIASLPRLVGPLAGDGALVAPWMATMQEAWAQGTGGLSVAGDALWAFPPSLLTRL
jgi:hypothetical protein